MCILCHTSINPYSFAFADHYHARAEANPSSHWETWTCHQSVSGITQRERNQFTLTFKLTT